MNTKFLLVVIFCLQLTSIAAQERHGNSALLVIDVQEQFTLKMIDSLESGIFISDINTIIESARPMEIIFIKANTRVLSVSFKGIKTDTLEASDLDGRLFMKKNDRVFSKYESSAFTVPELTEYLEEKGIDQLYLVGIMLGQCLSNTAYDGVKRGYSVTVIEEGVRAKRASRFNKLLQDLVDEGVEVINSGQFLSRQSN